MTKQERFYITSVKIGPKGQIVIPKEVREMFALKPGDSIALLTDKKRGIALQTAEKLDPFLKDIYDHLSLVEDNE